MYKIYLGNTLKFTLKKLELSKFVISRFLYLGEKKVRLGNE